MAEVEYMKVSHIIKSGRHNGRAYVFGSQATVWKIALAYTKMNIPPDMIAKKYDVSLAAVHSALAYYYQCKGEIDAEIQEKQDYLREEFTSNHWPEMITASEASEIFGISKQAIRQACRKEWVNSRKSGGVWIIDAQAACDRWGKGKT